MVRKFQVIKFTQNWTGTNKESVSNKQHLMLVDAEQEIQEFLDKTNPIHGTKVWFEIRVRYCK